MSPSQLTEREAERLSMCGGGSLESVICRGSGHQGVKTGHYGGLKLGNAWFSLHFIMNSTKWYT